MNEPELIEIVLEEQIIELKKQNDLLHVNLNSHKQQINDLLAQRNAFENTSKKLQRFIKQQQIQFYHIAQKWSVNQGFLSILMDDEIKPTEKQLLTVNMRMDVNTKMALINYEKFFKNNLNHQEIISHQTDINAAWIVEKNINYFKSFILLNEIELQQQITSDLYFKHNLGYFDKLVKNIFFILIKNTEKSSSLIISASKENQCFILNFNLIKKEKVDNINRSDYNNINSDQTHKTIAFNNLNLINNLRNFEKFYKTNNSTKFQNISIVIEQLP